MFSIDNNSTKMYFSRSMGDFVCATWGKDLDAKTATLGYRTIWIKYLRMPLLHMEPVILYLLSLDADRSSGSSSHRNFNSRNNIAEGQKI